MVLIPLWGGAGDEVKIANGYARRYGDQLRISIDGKGSIEKRAWTK